MTRRRLLALLVSSVAATSCSMVGALMGKKDPPPPAPPPAPPPPPPPPPKLVVPERSLELSLVADSALNVDSRNTSAPVIVRVYLIKSAVTFQSADFFALFERDQSTLGADLLSRDEMDVRPGETLKLSRPLPAEARMIAVLAAFRDLEHAKWRTVAELPAPPAPMADPPAKPIPVPVRLRAGAREVRVAGIG